MASWEAFRISLRRELAWLKSNFWHWGMISVLPLIFSLLLWDLFSLQIPRDLSIGVVDLDNTSITRHLIRYLDASPGLAVTNRFSSQKEAESALRSGTVVAVLFIPKHLTQSVKTQRRAELVLQHNAQFGTHSPLVQRDVRKAVATLSAGVKINIKVKRGATPQTAVDTVNPLQVVLVPMFNRSSNYQIYLAGALIPTLLHIVAMLTGAYIFGRELKDRTLGKWLSRYRSSPTLSILLGAIAGKILPSLIAFSLQGLLFLYLFEGVLKASGVALIENILGMVFFFSVCLLLGACFSLLTRSLRLGLTISSFISAPAFTFSGIGFPMESFPSFAVIWAKLLPLTHYLSLQVNLLQIGIPTLEALPVLLGFLFYALLLLILLQWLVQLANRHPETWGAR
ncbi:MAG: ABC transporter permease [Neisseriaceae bacterium]